MSGSLAYRLVISPSGRVLASFRIFKNISGKKRGQQAEPLVREALSLIAQCSST